MLFGLKGILEKEIFENAYWWHRDLFSLPFNRCDVQYCYPAFFIETNMTSVYHFSMFLLVCIFNCYCLFYSVLHIRSGNLYTPYNGNLSGSVFQH